MVSDLELLQGEVTQNPETEEKDVERLLVGLLKALLNEQQVMIGKPKPELK